jgi:transposase
MRGERTDIFHIRKSTLEAHFALSRRAMGRWLSQRRRTLEAAESAWLSRLLARRRRMDDTAPACRAGFQSTTAQSANRQSDRANYDHGPCSPEQGRRLHNRRHRDRRSRSRGSTADASTSLFASFANGIKRDKAAVYPAITEPWSNGQTEGQITKLKLVKRQMYGRAKLDLLQARLIGAV